MRQITLKPGVAFSTTKVLLEVLKVPGPVGVSADEMRDRLRLIELVEAAEGSRVLELDNADFEQIAQLIRGFRFGMVTRELLEIIDGILDTPPGARPRLAS